MANWNKVEPVILVCPTCLKEFSFRPRKFHSKKFCTRKCFTDSLKGKKHSQERITKRTAQIRKTFSEHPEINKALGEKRRGKKYPPSHGEKISLAKIRSIQEKGFSRPKKYITQYQSTKTGKTEMSDSSYETRRFKALDESPLVKKWTKAHGIRIQYREKNRRRNYLPDILVEYHDGSVFLEEVKGYVRDRWNFALKNVAAMLYCHQKGYTFRIVFREQLDSVV